ncbi:2-hydroxychromene-2-carboxylate isomerase [uncultured Rhodoblastus sp.]|uniref:2-hydroxychromene-2-carboxylate isomerase n=1 Tax=uncultured Rhodoblastus sp. TaxID=543037 RepID=UPI0025D2FAEB|nr:2-hydroxychromene-2-carboxylate isomerase [uncultured Rhodoblastus sp.]
MTRRITVYFSLLSPWAYIGHAEFLRLVAKHGLQVDWRPVALSQVFPESGGLPLAKRHPARQKYRILELQRWREKRRLDFHLHPQFWPFDPSAGDRIVCALVLDGADPAKFIAAAFAGIFEQQRNLADKAELAAILRESGYEPGGLERGESDEAEAAYRSNLALALEAGAFGSPTYVLDGEIFWGQDRLELLDDALTSGRSRFDVEA